MAQFERKIYISSKFFNFFITVTTIIMHLYNVQFILSGFDANIPSSEVQLIEFHF